MYKMVQFSKKCNVEIIDKGKYFWATRKDLEVESDVANWAQIFDKCDPEKQKYRHKWMPNTEFNRVDLYEMVWWNEKLKAAENHQKNF